MKIVLSGVETNNKGAELMLYAILQEIEREFPDADVYINAKAVRQGLDYVQTKLKLHYWPMSRCLQKTHFGGICRRLGIPSGFIDKCFVTSNYFLDGSGFRFSDQTNLYGQRPEWWESVLKNQYRVGSKIVFLPQAFGPIEMIGTKKAIASISKYASLIMPRDNISYDFLERSEIVDMNKVKLFTDFTSLVDGIFPSKYEHLRNGVCIIPNMKMISKGIISYDEYIRLLSMFVEKGRKSGCSVYLLNHEGPKDEQLAYECQKSIGSDIEVVTRLNALEVKGLIASAYIVVTSRFHGLASALNCCVPSLATSWSHKYQELFHDYGISEGILPLDNLNKAFNMIEQLLDSETNALVRAGLKRRVPLIKAQTRGMWNAVWSK